MSEPLRFFAPCPSGVEALLADELRALRLRGVRPQRSGVLFSGGVADGMRAVFESRLATRILLQIAEVDATSADSFYEGIRALPWEDHLRADGTLAIDAGGVNDALRNTQFVAVRAKDAIVDRFRERWNRRPSVNVADPDVRVNIALRAERATVSIDLAGQPLHRRGYREPGVQVEAPMKETMAAAVLAFAGWGAIASEGGALVDPMCGSGTLAIEAALVACDVAPGLLRESHPMSRWLGFDADAFGRIVKRAEERRERGLARAPFVFASDADKNAVRIAKQCVERAGLARVVSVGQRDLGDLVAPAAATGLIATNPPWGERLGDRAALPELYATLARVTGTGFTGWRLAVVSPDETLANHLGMRAERVQALGGGKGGVRVSLFDLGQIRLDTPAPRSEVQARALDHSAFANRLEKMARHRAKWARRARVSCYRVYDADLPDYALAIDVYESAVDLGRRFVHIAEYEPPAEIDPVLAAQRLEAAVEIAARVFEVAPGAVFVKQRKRQRGTAQYERSDQRRMIAQVSEGGLRFEVNLSEYLDTGLFLDHRITRALVGTMALGTRFLNLFAYTGSATAYAVAGGAVASTTVDLSATYLAWAERNLAINGLAGPTHEFLRADVLAWLAHAAEQGRVFDLIFCDPPTFSNSKRTEETFDVQRDHVRLIRAALAVLAPGGTIVFSCNRRAFELDAPAIAAMGLDAADITASTIPPDFERNRKIHHCYRIARR